ncbi:hypothetical protein CRE_03234 [Caenorhabditis remanei]|uniref:Uncharacterized protein n=1 Tax=Caenorhabditis remanei TaxID=31234 RepID=E3MMH7_CAERE|nr:hypothetical protein CRE_03234 [Caenorhabditis remanei]
MSDHTDANFLEPKNFDRNHTFIMNVTIYDMIANPNTAGMYPQFHNFISTHNFKCYDPSKYKGYIKMDGRPTLEKYRQLFYEMLHLMCSKDVLKHDVEKCNIENRDLFVENSQLRNSVNLSISDKSMASFLRVLDDKSQGTVENQSDRKHYDITDNTWIHMMRNEQTARQKFVDDEIEFIVNNIATERTLLNEEAQDLKNSLKVAFSRLLIELDDGDFERFFATPAEKNEPFLSPDVLGRSTVVRVEGNDKQISSLEKQSVKESHTHENAACQTITYLHKKKKKNSRESVAEITQVPSNSRKKAEVFPRNACDLNVKVLNLIANTDIQTMYPAFYNFMTTEYFLRYDPSNNKTFFAPSIEKHRQLCNEMLHLMYFKCHLEHIYEQRIAKNQELKAENDWLRSYVVTSWGDVFINSFFRVFRNSFQDKNQRAGENCVRTEDTWDNMMTRLRDEKVAEGTIINDKIELVVNNIVKEYPLFNKEKEYLKNILKTALTSGFTDIEVKEFCSSPFQETGSSLPARVINREKHKTPGNEESNSTMMSPHTNDFYRGFTCFPTSKRKVASNALQQ